jgi:hypothetical protein
MMKNLTYLFFLLTFLTACATNSGEDEMPAEEKWTERVAEISGADSLIHGSTYLSVYSHIYSISEHKIHNLTKIVSLRNTSRTETVYIKKADYFDTKGKLIKHYLDKPVYLKPMETAEIMIFEKDVQGGMGGNFIFDWATEDIKNKPYFEGVMVSTSGHQGLSFTTLGVEL